jgi:UDP-N-acetylmuramoyl-L-alanyl-D-glutamate--2,6-diaminopimelate ligase
MNSPTVFPITCHTNHVGPGSTFVAIKGHKQDGAQYISQAVEKGAITIVAAHDAVLADATLEMMRTHQVTVQRVADTRLALAQLSAQVHGFPASKLKIIGITGTKGKTTSVFLLEQVLRSAGYKTALLSSVHNRILDKILPTSLTTQQPDYLHWFFKQCVEAGVTHVIMEVAAQAFSLHRVHGLEFAGVLYTNFDATHAEFYPDVHDYFAAKEQIFSQCAPHAPIVINADNSWCQQLIKRYPYVTTFGITNPAQVTAAVHGNVGNGIEVEVTSAAGSYTINCPTLIGLFSVYNVVGVATLSAYLGVSQQQVIKAFASFDMVPGRLERYAVPNGATCIIDYAHNSLSFESILSTLRPLTPQLIVVFGCGGDRDVTMRPVMGGIAAQYADAIILTTDNPRSEDPRTIIEHISAGIKPEYQAKVVVILDRKQAIEHAYTLSKPGAIITLLGKGRDEYQQVGTVKTHFSEVEIVRGLR